MKKDKSIRDYLAGIGRKGGMARAERHSKSQLKKWAKLGGRPKLKETNKGETK
jgi:hypothetical protein